MKSTSALGCSWDKAKAQANERKHGITFELAVTVLRDNHLSIAHDRGHDGPDDRWIVIGTARNGVLVVVICAFENGDDDVRIISARKPTIRERREYESGDYTIREPVMTDEYDPKPSSEAEDDDPAMREYDFSNAIRGMFANCLLPIPIENSILGYFHQQEIATGVRTEDAINEILRRHVAATGYKPPVFAERR